MYRIGFIGSGNMAEALIKGVLSTGLYGPGEVCASDINNERLGYIAGEYKICPENSNSGLAARSSIVILSVEPQNISEVLEEIKDSLTNDAVVISIAAGITAETIAGALGKVQVIRVMPNMPALVGNGMSGIYSTNATADSLQMAVKLFSAVGKTIVVESEELINALTAVSGSGPAYFFLLIEEMIKAAEKLGLSGEAAKELVLQTARGAAILAYGSEHGPAELRKKVASPGGTTEAAIKVFADGGFGELVANAITAARDRSIELSG
jgi:pyrroline-5-carboxylate reductase